MTTTMRVWRVLRAVLKCGALLGAGYLLAFASAVAGNKGLGIRPVKVDATVAAPTTRRDRLADRLIRLVDSGAGEFDA